MKKAFKKKATKAKKKTEYRVWEIMPLAIYDCELWYKGECLGTKKLTNGEAFFEPMFVYKPGSGVAVHYNWEDEKQWAMTMKHWFEARPERYDAEEKKYKEMCKEILELSKKPDVKIFHRLAQLIDDTWPLLTAVTSIGNYHEKEPTDISARALQLRRETDQVSYIAAAALDSLLEHKLSPHHFAERDYITWAEMMEGPLPSQEVIDYRKKGYVYHQGKLHHPEDLEQFCDEHGIYVYKEKIKSDTEIKGTSACKGIARGRVVRLLDREDEKKDFTDAILVTAMTTPYWINQMKLAKAFVTDLGGITCHAAIVAREIGKPCIIGTKIATQLLKDGDLVEVDADRGVVKILERATK